MALYFRNLFSWFSFVLFFYNGLAGVVGAIFRIAMSAAFSLILLFRLDEVALMKKFDSFDFGKIMYMQLVRVASRQNACMHDYYAYSSV